ncbi:GIY-YIG nuclease family protein [uncultured Prevotella sp.]|uniref:GIY-YIG nuclease family protein n=1 Tax=uncultured Prevotella sp. TaxID=159272 RepID=UPI0025D9EF28|nr:GIY-YIG nuclease family protein [uncultured Prevotella sp.]
MDIDKELEALFDDPLLNVSEEEKSLFEIPQDMRRVIAKKKADYVAQHKLCENFDDYKPLFAKVHRELKQGLRSLVKITKTATLAEGRFYFVSGQMLLLEKIGELKKSSNFLPDARTRCIYENGTESDILLQTLRKNVVGDGYAVTELQEDVNGKFFSNSDITADDKVTGYIYVLSSLSQDPVIKDVKHLYKIGFSTNSVEQRIANAENEPTYLMAPVKIQATYKVVNVNSQKFEDLIHQVLKPAQFQVSVFDDKGAEHQPQEWFIVPLPVVDVIIQKIMDGSIVGYTYNPEQECLEKRIIKEKSTFDTKGMKVLTLNIKKIYFDDILSGAKKIEYRELKQTTLNKYTYLDESDGKRYLRRYDAIRLFVGYHKARESALVQVKDITYRNGVVEYHLGLILEVINNKHK